MSAREDRPKRSGGAVAPWLIFCILIGAIAAALDFTTARPQFWLAALPLGRAGIGLGAALFVLGGAWALRFLLGRHGAHTVKGAGDDA